MLLFSIKKIYNWKRVIKIPLMREYSCYLLVLMERISITYIVNRSKKCMLLKVLCGSDVRFNHAFSTWGLCSHSFTLEEFSPVLNSDSLTNVCHNALSLFFVKTFIPPSQREHKRLVFPISGHSPKKTTAQGTKLRSPLRLPCLFCFLFFFVGSDTTNQGEPNGWNFGEVFHERVI